MGHLIPRRERLRESVLPGPWSAYGVHMGGRGRVSRSPSFTESLARPEREAPEPILNLASVAEFTDANGVLWRRRGTAYVDDKRLRKLLRDPAVRVLHDYIGDVTELPSSERGAFWASAQDSLAESCHSDFVGSEFKNDAFERLLVIHEYC